MALSQGGVLGRDGPGRRAEDGDRKGSSADEKRTYDRIRAQVERSVSCRVPTKLRRAAEALLLLPDLAVLMFRLMKDPRVPASAKTRLALALAYVLSPVDLIPDFVPVAGQVDDLAAAVLVVTDMMKSAPKEAVLDNWSGPPQVIGTLETTLDVAGEILKRDVLGALSRHFGSKRS